MKPKKKKDREYRVYGNLGPTHRSIEKAYGTVSRFRKGYNRCGALQSEKEVIRFPLFQ